MENNKMKKGYIKRGNIIVTMTGDICCPKENCPYINDIGCCTEINAKCEYEKQRFDALLHYGFADDKPVTMEIRKAESK